MWRLTKFYSVSLQDVLLTSITLQLANKAAQSFTMYTATGGFDDKYQNETLWTKVFGPVTGTTPGRKFISRSH